METFALLTAGRSLTATPNARSRDIVTDSAPP
ncbi:hypothetical protein CSHISOI_11220, partial [Colletotrichum shisoi]